MSWLGAPTALRLQSVLDGELAREELEPLARAVRGPRVSLTVANGTTTLVLSENIARLAAATFLAMFNVVAIVTVFITMLGVRKWAPVVFLALAAAAMPLARQLYARTAAKRAAELERIQRALEAEIKRLLAG